MSHMGSAGNYTFARSVSIGAALIGILSSLVVLLAFPSASRRHVILWSLLGAFSAVTLIASSGWRLLSVNGRPRGWIIAAAGLTAPPFGLLAYHVWPANVSPVPPSSSRVSLQPQVVRMISAITTERIRTEMLIVTGESLAKSRGAQLHIHRDDLFARHKAQDYYFDRLASLGYEVHFQDVTPTLRNIVATKHGTTNLGEIVIVGAHFDSISTGADDNGTGVSAVMITAEEFASRTFERTVRFILFDGEEGGYRDQILNGSRAYANSVITDNIKAVVTIDQIGYDGNHDNRAQTFIGSPHDPQYGADLHAAGIWANVISTYSINLIPDISATHRNDSDMYSFWEAHNSKGKHPITAIAIAEDVEGDETPHGHSTHDTVANLVFPYLTNTTRAVVATVAHLASPNNLIQNDRRTSDSSH